jgi:hypothetical protein
MGESGLGCPWCASRIVVAARSLYLKEAEPNRGIFMENIHLLICSIVLTTEMSSNSFASNYAHFHFIGFFKDGKYRAFEEYGRPIFD